MNERQRPRGHDQVSLARKPPVSSISPAPRRFSGLTSSLTGRATSRMTANWPIAGGYRGASNQNDFGRKRDQFRRPRASLIGTCGEDLALNHTGGQGGDLP